MNVEYTGRQYEITPTIRKQVEHGLAKLTRFLGNNFEGHVVLTAEKHRCRAEITINNRNHPLVGLAEAEEMVSAVAEALNRIERQALKYRARWRTMKRQPRHKFLGEVGMEEVKLAVGADASAAVPVVVHTFPSIARTTEPHVVQSNDSVSLHPMTLEEAIKEAQFRDRDVFVFRDEKGRVKVLHRTKDGKMELIEAP
jgi:putative sigma-54 modulation protein